MSGEAVIGLMDSAYFVSKNQLLRWINQTLKMDLAYVQDLGAGSIYCQLVDAYHKHGVAINKVNWKAKFQYEFVNNLKLYQQALEKIGVTKKIDVNKLAKARYQDNLEMIQWLKRYLQMTSTPLTEYDALHRRNNETFYSHHSQKNSFVNKPGRANLTSCLSAMNITMKKEQGVNQENGKVDKIQKIKRILSGKEESERKLLMISEIVYGGNFSKALQKKQFNSGSKTPMEEEVL